jgi:hypothetical protein
MQAVALRFNSNDLASLKISIDSLASVVRSNEVHYDSLNKHFIIYVLTMDRGWTNIKAFISVNVSQCLSCINDTTQWSAL